MCVFSLKPHKNIQIYNQQQIILIVSFKQLTSDKELEKRNAHIEKVVDVFGGVW